MVLLGVDGAQFRVRITAKNNNSYCTNIHFCTPYAFVNFELLVPNPNWELIVGEGRDRPLNKRLPFP
jgi:hypothetical protein